MRDRLHAVVLACAVVLALAGAVGAVQVRADDTSPSNDSAATKLPPSPVTLLEAGSQPKILMRLTPKVGFEQRTTQHQEQKLRLTVDGRTAEVSTPPIELDIRTRVTAVANHRVSTTSTYEAARVLDAPGTTAAVKSAMTQTGQSLVGQSINCARTDAGVMIRCSHLHVTFPDAVKKIGDELVKGLENDLPNLSMPFPTEPVGVGARWTFAPKPRVLGLRSTSLSEVKVTRIIGRRVEATLTQSIKFVPGPTKFGDVSGTIESGELAGGGSIVWNLAATDPLLNSALEGTVVITAGSGQGAQRLEQFQHQSIRITERK